jgi:hypothetical protein
MGTLLDAIDDRVRAFIQAQRRFRGHGITSASSALNRQRRLASGTG